MHIPWFWHTYLPPILNPPWKMVTSFMDDSIAQWVCSINDIAWARPSEASQSITQRPKPETLFKVRIFWEGHKIWRYWVMLSFNMVRLDLSLSGEYPSCRVLPFNRDPPRDVLWVSIPKLTVLVVSRALNEENQVTMHVHASVVASYCIPALTLNHG